MSVTLTSSRWRSPNAASARVQCRAYLDRWPSDAAARTMGMYSDTVGRARRKRSAGDRPNSARSWVNNARFWSSIMEESLFGVVLEHDRRNHRSRMNQQRV